MGDATLLHIATLARPELASPASGAFACPQNESPSGLCTEDWSFAARTPTKAAARLVVPPEPAT
jgi:hypothetical protein